MVTATDAQAAYKADLEIAAPVLTDPTAHRVQSSPLTECGWKHGQIGVGRTMAVAVSAQVVLGNIAGLSEDLPSETNQGASPRLQAGGREPGAKQKAFGTVLATAPSPAFYLAAKKSRGQLGDLFAASEKPERGEVEGRGT